MQDIISTRFPDLIDAIRFAIKMIANVKELVHINY